MSVLLVAIYKLRRLRLPNGGVLRIFSQAPDEGTIQLLKVQEAMESFAFPVKIDGIKNWWIYFGPLKVLQKRSKLNVFHWKYQENTLFHFDC